MLIKPSENFALKTLSPTVPTRRVMVCSAASETRMETKSASGNTTGPKRGVSAGQRPGIRPVRIPRLPVFCGQPSEAFPRRRSLAHYNDAGSLPLPPQSSTATAILLHPKKSLPGRHAYCLPAVLLCYLLPLVSLKEGETGALWIGNDRKAADVLKSDGFAVHVCSELLRLSGTGITIVHQEIWHPMRRYVGRNEMSWQDAADELLSVLDVYVT